MIAPVAAAPYVLATKRTAAQSKGLAHRLFLGTVDDVLDDYEDDPDAPPSPKVAAHAGRIGNVIHAAQMIVGRFTSAYLAERMKLSQVPPVPQSITIRDTGIAKNVEYQRPYNVATAAMRQGSSRQRSIAAAFDRLNKLADTDIQMSKVRQAQIALKAGRRKTFRRTVTGLNPCPLCEVAADQIYYTDQLMPIHMNCSCIVEPDEDFEPMSEDRVRNILTTIPNAPKNFDPTSDNLKSLIKVRIHSEVGPTLTWKHQNFTTLADLTKLKQSKPKEPIPNIRRKVKLEGAPTADLKAVNPKWSEGREWQTNCTRCATAYELRRRGYEALAKPLMKEDNDNDHLGELDKWLSPDGSVAGSGSLLTADRKPDFDEVLGMSKGTRVFHVLPAGSGLANKARIDDAVRQWGDGARGYVTVIWKGRRSAHIFNVENRGGKVVYVDSQTRKEDVHDYFKRVSIKDRSVFVVRVDDLTPRENIDQWVYTNKELTAQEVEAKAAAERAAKLATGPTTKEIIVGAHDKGHFEEWLGDFVKGVHAALTEPTIDADAYSDNSDRNDAYLDGFFWCRHWKQDLASAHV